MLVSPGILRQEVLRCLLYTVVRNEHIRVNFLSSLWIESTLNGEMLLYHFFFVSVSALNDYGLFHDFIAYRTLEKVRHLKWSLILFSIQILREVMIHRAWVLHGFSLGRKLNRHEVLIRLHLFLQIDHHCCLFICFNLALLVKFYFLRLQDLLLDCVFILSYFLTSAERVGFPHSLYSFINQCAATNVQLSLFN